MSNHRESLGDDNYKDKLETHKQDFPSNEDFQDLQEEVRNVKEDLQDIKEDVELLDKANKDSADRWRSLLIQISLLILSGVVTALLSRFLG